MIVLDTCVVIWLANDPAMLSKAALAAVSDARSTDGVAISCVTLFEIAWLAARKRISSKLPIENILAQIEANFRVLPTDSSVAKLAADLPASYPRDAMDRIIGATALAMGVALVTPDQTIHDSGAVPVIW